MRLKLQAARRGAPFACFVVKRAPAVARTRRAQNVFQ